MLVWFTYSLTRLSNIFHTIIFVFLFDSLIHLQDSQTMLPTFWIVNRLIHLFTYKTLKLLSKHSTDFIRLIHLFTYKTLKLAWKYHCTNSSLIHLFTYKTLKLTQYDRTNEAVWFTYSLTRLSNTTIKIIITCGVWFTYSLTRLSNDVVTFVL